MVKYVKIDDSELGNKLRFLLYIRNKKPDWKLITAKNRKLLGETVPDVNLSDFDFFMACYPKPVFE